MSLLAVLIFNNADYK